MGGIISYVIGGVEEQEVEEVSLLDLVNPTLQVVRSEDDARILWNRIRQRLRTHPEEAAAYARSIDSSPLYRAMQLAHTHNTRLPLNLVRSFLDEYEDCVFDTTAAGESILFAAVYGSSLVAQDDDNTVDDSFEIVKLLMEYNSEAASQNTIAKMLPLHHVRNDVRIAKILLRAHPEGSVAKDTVGRIPLFHCCSGDHVRAPATPATEQPDDGEERDEEQQDDGEEDDEEQQADENDNDATEEQVSPSLTLTHPDVVAELIVSARQCGLADGGILTKDQAGKTPLDQLCHEISGELNDTEKPSDESSSRVAHLWKSLEIMVRAVSPQDKEDSFRMVHSVIALNCSPAIVAHALKLHPEQAGERDSKGCTPLMLAALSLDTVHPAVICTLLKFYPEAACMTDADGRLPIDIIAESSKYDEELWEALVKAEPRAVDTRDLRDKMFPFMTAAVGDKSNMNTVFRLLRAKPHVLSYFNLE